MNSICLLLLFLFSLFPCSYIYRLHFRFDCSLYSIFILGWFCLFGFKGGGGGGVCGCFLLLFG